MEATGSADYVVPICAVYSIGTVGRDTAHHYTSADLNSLLPVGPTAHRLELLLSESNRYDAECYVTNDHASFSHSQSSNIISISKKSNGRDFLKLAPSRHHEAASYSGYELPENAVPDYSNCETHTVTLFEEQNQIVVLCHPTAKDENDTKEIHETAVVPTIIPASCSPLCIIPFSECTSVVPNTKDVIDLSDISELAPSTHHEAASYSGYELPENAVPDYSNCETHTVTLFEEQNQIVVLCHPTAKDENDTKEIHETAVVPTIIPASCSPLCIIPFSECTSVVPNTKDVIDLSDTSEVNFQDTIIKADKYIMKIIVENNGYHSEEKIAVPFFAASKRHTDIIDNNFNFKTSHATSVHIDNSLSSEVSNCIDGELSYNLAGKPLFCEHESEKVMTAVPKIIVDNKIASSCEIRRSKPETYMSVFGSPIKSKPESIISLTTQKRAFRLG